MSTVQKNQRIALYTVQVETLQPFHIGAFQDPMSDVNSPVTTLGGQAVIQGASLKGALRAQIEEYLILNYGQDAAMKPCIPAPRNNLSADEQGLIPARYRGPDCGYEARGTRSGQVNICPACYLLGTMGLVGFVQTPYLYLTSEHEVEEVYNNRRDRALNRVADGANRTLQALPAGSVFQGTLEVILEDHIRRWTLGQARPLKAPGYSDAWLVGHVRKAEDVLREFIEERLTSITRLGGQVSKGFGNVKVTVTAAGEKAV